MLEKLYHTNIFNCFTMLFFVAIFTGCTEKIEHLESPKTVETLKPQNTQTVQAIKQDVSKPIDNKIYDKLGLSQNILEYANEENITSGYSFLDSSTVKKKLFMVWDDDFKASISESLWVLDIVKKDGYRENLQPYSSDERARFVSEIYSATNVNHLGLISRNSDIRAFPTKKPYFYDPKKAGEGYPFDNFQSSRIYVNTPVRVVAVSNDGAFYYIASSVTDGWIDSRDVTIISKQQSNFLKNSNLLMCVKDKASILDENGKFIEKAQVGSFVYENDGTTYSASGDKLTTAAVEKKHFIQFPILYSHKVFAYLANEIMNESYGWGGFLDNRDCSMFLRDLFLPFGLYLPRNSFAQATKGDGYVDFGVMNESKKLEMIKQRGKPFETFLYLKGHILLYLGTVNDEIVALHDVWGFAYDEKGVEKRHVVGRPVITTLYMGSSHDSFITKKSIAYRLKGMRVLQ